VQADLLIAGRYRLVRRIGAGGMGEVWLAENELTEREFAIKLLHERLADSPEEVRRFLQEARFTGRLRHPNIVEVFDVGAAPELGGVPFIVMELLDGPGLDRILRQGGAIPMRAALLIGLAIARALEAAHAKGIVHRDVKPANVILHHALGARSGAATSAHGSGSGSGVVPKLLDFGVGKLARDHAGAEVTTGKTATGVMIGSPAYMSPEQASADGAIDHRSDIHALGVLLWCMLVGRSPFQSTAMPGILMEIIATARPRLSDALPGVPAAVEAIVSRAFASSPEDRFQTTTELAAALEAALLETQGPSLDAYAEPWSALSSVSPASNVPPPPVSEGSPPVDRTDIPVHSSARPSAPPFVEPTEILVDCSESVVAPLASRWTTRRYAAVALGIALGAVVVGFAATTATRGRLAPPPSASSPASVAAAAAWSVESGGTAGTAMATAPAPPTQAMSSPSPVASSAPRTNVTHTGNGRKPSPATTPAVNPTPPANLAAAPPAPTAPSPQDPSRGVQSSGL
jgi:serine/threonine-protein kinase